MPQLHMVSCTATLLEASGCADESRVAVLRAGVHLPDWSLVQTEAGRQALDAAFRAVDMGRKWSHLNELEDRVWRSVLELYAEDGRAPTLSRLAETVGTEPPAVADSLQNLKRRDLVILGPDGAITGAYPFADHLTEHRVRLGASEVIAMCAVDALGMGAMLGRDAVIQSRCRYCGKAVEITTADRGRALASVLPDSAIVWSGIQYASGCAATSLCTVQAFFCSEHLRPWRRDAAASARGIRLSLEEGLQVGKAIFVPMLQPGTA
jgi:mercuric reductase